MGIGCRFPGGVDGPDGLWDVVSAGRDVVSEFPTDRGWDVEGYTIRIPTLRQNLHAMGAFLDDATGFDAGFFGIAPSEVLAMDPQQRLMLEVSWEALEHAGLTRCRCVVRRPGCTPAFSRRVTAIGIPGAARVRVDRHVNQRGLGTCVVRIGAAGPGGVSGYRLFVVVGGDPLGDVVIALRGV